MNESRHVCMSHVKYQSVTYERVTSHMNESRHIWMSHVTYERVTSHMNESCHVWMRHFTCMTVIHVSPNHTWVSRVTHVHETCPKSDMGWLRSVGSIKSQVSFAEYRLFYRALLQKRLMILSILLSEAIPWWYLWIPRTYRYESCDTWMRHETYAFRM